MMLVIFFLMACGGEDADPVRPAPDAGAAVDSGLSCTDLYWACAESLRDRDFADGCSPCPDECFIASYKWPSCSGALDPERCGEMARIQNCGGDGACATREEQCQEAISETCQPSLEECP